MTVAAACVQDTPPLFSSAPTALGASMAYIHRLDKPQPPERSILLASPTARISLAPSEGGAQ